MPRSVEQLANQQVLRWLEERTSRDHVPPSRVQEVQRPMITISRQYGALGGEIGRRVSAELGTEFWSQEIVHEVARRKDVRKQVVEALDERTQTRIQHFIDNMMTMRGFSVDDYVRALSETILSLGRSRTGVIVGRGGHLILDPKRTVRVRCYSAAEFRAKFISSRDGMSLEEARAKVARVDEERRAFYERNFQSDITLSTNFDLMLNTSSLSLDECASAIVALFRARFGSPD